jgi:DNA adenine methylase
MSLSPLRYPGGKSRAIEPILKRIPANITEFREPFVGGGSVFLAVKKLFQKRITQYWINDLNTDLYCFWYYVREDVTRLADCAAAFKEHHTDGKGLYTLLKNDTHIRTDFDRAVRFFVMNRITFSGIADSGGFSQASFEKRFTASSIQRLRDVAYYLTQVNITHGDYADVVQAPGENVFLFLDPPYWSATQSRLYGTRGNLHTGFDHERFAQTMRQCTHRWLITYDDSPYIRDLFAFAHITEWQLQYGMNNYKQGKADKGLELFIQNY